MKNKKHIIPYKRFLTKNVSKCNVSNKPRFIEAPQDPKPNIDHLRERLSLLYQISVIEKKEPPFEMFEEFLEIMYIIKNSDLYELKDNLFKLLESPCELVRQDVVATLGFTSRLFLPEFRDRAFEIFLKDPDDYVKDTALSCWCNYFRGTKNKNILIKLYQILNNDNYSKSIRYTAYYGIFETIEARGSHADNLKNFQQNPKYQGKKFSNALNWQAVEKAIRKYAPEALL